MSITRRAFSGGALALLAASTISSSQAQTKQEGIMLKVKPFKINISDAAITDLKNRLGQARWPHAITNDWSRGQPIKLIMELADQ